MPEHKAVTGETGLGPGQLGTAPGPHGGVSARLAHRPGNATQRANVYSCSGVCGGS